jgi:hypothetical protein
MTSVGPLGQNISTPLLREKSSLELLPDAQLEEKSRLFSRPGQSEIKKGAWLGRYTRVHAEEVAYDEEPPGDSNYALFSFSGAEKFCPSVRNFPPTPQGCKIAGWPGKRMTAYVQGNYGRVPCTQWCPRPADRTALHSSRAKSHAGLSLRRARARERLIPVFERVLYSNYYHRRHRA